ncbi:MAG: hypothetical protein LBL73_12550 [Synergistaceae bacterium]|nr:hypothetical protein [Synergistaceae bacterium]
MAVIESKFRKMGQAGAKALAPCSCHNLTKADFVSGETCLSLMKKNAPNPRKGLC